MRSGGREPGLGLVQLARLEHAQIAGAQPAERADRVPQPVLVGRDGEPAPGPAVPQTDRPRRLEVLPEGAEVQAREVGRGGEEEVDGLPAIQHLEDRREHLVVLVPGQLPGGEEPDRAGRHVVEPFDHRSDATAGAVAGPVVRRAEVAASGLAMTDSLAGWMAISRRRPRSVGSRPGSSAACAPARPPARRLTALNPTIGEYLVDALMDRGVRHVFGVPGDFILRLFQIGSERGMGMVNSTREETATYAADGYAREAGLGAAAVTFGVGTLAA